MVATTRPPIALTRVIELRVTEDGAARLLRLPALAACRAGRPRKSAVNIVWHDTADRSFSAAGLSVSEIAGQWRLEKLYPEAGDAWFPATPAPVIAEAADLNALPLDSLGPLRGPLTPIAAFAGHRRDIQLTVDGSPARLSLLEGDLRGVILSRPVRMIQLAGPTCAMAQLAVGLGEQISLAIPLASLGAEALALADNATARPRHRGGPVAAPGSSIDEAFCEIVAHLADVIHFWAPLVGDAQTEEPVHQMRVALRRLRSALSIFRRAFRQDTAWLDSLAADLQTLAATLGVARDWDVFLAGIGAAVTEACNDDKRLLHMLATAGRKREAAYATLRAELGISPAWQRLGLTLALLPSLRPWDMQSTPDQVARLAATAETYAAGALDRRLKDLLGAGDSLKDAPAEDLHAIRKKAKRLRYAIEFFRPLFPQKPLNRYLARLEDLQEEFGTFNDATVAAGLAASLGSGADRAFAAGTVQGFGAASQWRARRQIARGWSKFYRATPFWD